MKVLRYSSALLALILLACPTPSIPPTPQKEGEPLPTDMSYAAATVPIDGSAELRTISVRLFNAPSAADYAFEPPSSKPTWLSISDRGTISGTVPTNASPSKTYTIRVTGRGTYAGSMQDISFTLKVSNKEFNTPSAAGNRNHRGIWSDGTTMWVADNPYPWGGKIYAYSMSTKARESAKDFDTLSAARNTDPQGIWSDGTTMWVADNPYPWGGKIYAYSMSTKVRESAKDFNTLTLAAGNRDPQGIWSDGITMWVADSFDDKIYAYSMSTKARDSAKDFNTLSAAGNRNPRGIWSDGTTMWVADYENNKIYAYNMSTKTHDSAKDFNTLIAAGNRFPRGIWSDGTTMWVADSLWGRIYAYSMSTKEYTP